MAVYDLGERVGETDVRIDVVELTGFDQRGDNSLVFPHPSEPAKSAFPRLRAMGLIERSTVLESISIRSRGTG